MDVVEVPRVEGRHRNKALAIRRRTRAVELVLTGRTYQQVADEMGYANRGTVYRIVQEAAKAQEVDLIAELRQLEAARLDAVQRAHWYEAMEGDTTATGIVLRVMDQRVKLLGLYPDKPGRTAGRGRPADDAAASVTYGFGPSGELVALSLEH